MSSLFADRKESHSMTQTSQLKHIVEAALLAAAQPLSLMQLAAPVRRKRTAAARGTGQGDRGTDQRLRRSRRGTGRSRLGLPLSGEAGRSSMGCAPVDRTPDQILARAARNARAHRLSPADHARRNRRHSRRRGFHQHHQDARRTRVGPRRGLSRRTRQTRAVRHIAHVPRLLRPEIAGRIAAAR